MIRSLKLAAALAAGLAFSGCAGIVEIRVPREFKDKKKIEDPPLSMNWPAQSGEAAG